MQGGQNFFCVTSRCLGKVVSCNRTTVFGFHSNHYQIFIIYTIKIDLTLNKLSIFKIKFTKFLRNLIKKFCEYGPRCVNYLSYKKLFNFNY